MNQKEINKQIFERLKKIEEKAFVKINEDETVIKKGSLPSFIVELRRSKFFKQPKIPIEVQKNLQPIYPCDLNRIEVALLRLQKKKQLRKTSSIVNGKKILAYVW